MIENEMLMRYAKVARAAGTEVEFLASADLPDRLASLLSKPGEAFCGSERGPADTSIPSAAHLAALPATGWPRELLESVEATLRASCYQVVMPQPAPEGLSWDRDLLARASIGITFCSTFLAETGSLVIPAGPGMGTLAALLPEVHLAVSYVEGCRESLADHFQEEGFSLPSRLTLVTGPSRTGDIEATMTTGVHGPRKVIHLILDR